MRQKRINMNIKSTVRKLGARIFVLCRVWFGSVVFEYAFMAVMGIALLGASGKYMVALGVLLACHWMHEKNKRIRQLERVIAVNSQFWRAPNADKSGLVKSMRDMCDAALPNVKLSREAGQ